MRIRKIVRLLTVLLIFPVALSAQVTTSSISGTVKQKDGQPIAGATITAIHQPSGTKYVTVSKKAGTFTISGMRSGGPYTLSFESVGFTPQQLTDINLALGDDYNANIALENNSTVLEKVVVTGSARSTANIKNGVSTSIGQRQITTLPTINRSITDFTRLTPQSNGNSIGGRDGRYNNVTIDGANLNNNFGLSTDPLPGGGSNPISMDAIEEISVNISPYDVRQSNFTGGNIAAVTKSGTNVFKGTAYTYYKEKDYIGTRVGKLRLTNADSKTNIWGGSIGGPIIKNKLFFFVNGEYENNLIPPATSYVPTGGTVAGTNTSTVLASDLDKVSNYVRTTYGYETGGYVQPNFGKSNYKLLGRVDWNISTKHKLTVKYSEFQNTNDVAVNSLSVPNSATSGTNTWTSVARLGANAYSFANSNYGFKDIVRNFSLEVNSNWNGKFANQFIATSTNIRDTRTTNSDLFPFVDIIGSPTGASYPTVKNNYISLGKEPYSNNNDVKNDIYNATDNFMIYAGRHTVTLGVAYEQQYVGNQFMPASQSYYTYGSIADFMNPTAHPIAFALTYSRVPGNDAPYSAELKIAQGSAYAQDEFNINSNLRLSYGLRIDKPIYPTQPIENPSITALTYPDKDGNPTNYSTGMWPKATMYFSPRVNLRWDVDGNKKLIIRGGSGIYTGKIPFVYLTNMPTNSGMYQVSALASATQLSQITFSKDPKAWQSLFTAPAPTPNTGGFVLIDKNYKFPQVWRTNIGFEQKYAHGLTLSMDVLYTKDLNATVLRNANEIAPTSTVNLGGSTRPSFANTTTSTRRLYNAYANTIVLENNKKGGGFSFTAQVSKSFSKGFYASLAYTYSEALDVTANPGSTAASVWSANPTSGTQNTKELSYSQFSTPHRIVGIFSYRKEYLKHLATTFSVFYEGSQAPGAAGGSQRISYVYGSGTGTTATGLPSGFANTADVNYDGNSQDLMYIPKNASEITFIPLVVSTPAGNVTYTAQQQSDAFFAFVAQDKYLSKHMGQVAERNGGKYPFYHKVDVKILQDIFVNIGKHKNTLQFSADCTNFLNLLNQDWGLRDFFPTSTPLRAAKNATTGAVVYQLATYTPNGSSTPILIDKSFIRSTSTASTWAIQLGLRYIF
ncbi:TonB-dependent receptor [Ferruginibacter sp.]